MKSFSSAANATGAVTPSHIVSDNHIDASQKFSHQVVSAFLRDPIAGSRSIAEVEQELDDVISDLADAAVAAEAQGDRVGATLYVRRLYAAVQSRTPAHQARLNSIAWDRIA